MTILDLLLDIFGSNKKEKGYIFYAFLLVLGIIIALLILRFAFRVLG